MPEDEMYWARPGDQFEQRRALVEGLVKTRLLKVFEKSPALHVFTIRLRERKEKLLLVGGAVRDWALNRANKDLDFVSSLAPEELERLLPAGATRTRFGGFRFVMDGIDVDVWSFATTVTLEGLPRGQVPFERFLELQPFNVDAVAYDMESGRLLEDGFFRCMDERILRRQYAGHPDQAYVEMRARKFLEKYGLRPSLDVMRFLADRERGRSG